MSVPAAVDIPPFLPPVTPRCGECGGVLDVNCDVSVDVSADVDAAAVHLQPRHCPCGAKSWSTARTLRDGALRRPVRRAFRSLPCPPCAVCGGSRDAVLVDLQPGRRCGECVRIDVVDDDIAPKPEAGRCRSPMRIGLLQVWGETRARVGRAKAMAAVAVIAAVVALGWMFARVV